MAMPVGSSSSWPFPVDQVAVIAFQFKLSTINYYLGNLHCVQAIKKSRHLHTLVLKNAFTTGTLPLLDPVRSYGTWCHCHSHGEV